MKTQISPMLAVKNVRTAIDFYVAAFGATMLWTLDDQVAGLEIDGAEFFLAVEAAKSGKRSPADAGFTTVRIELFVADPVAVHARALAAGGTERSTVVEHNHSTTRPQPISRMLQGSVSDPDGHIWLIGKFLK
jgi:PhnB protein